MTMVRNHSPAYLLFHHKVMIKRRYVEFHDDAFHEVFGVPTQESRADTNMQYEDLVGTHASAAELANMLDAGEDIILQNYDDARFLVKTINEYLDLWVNQVKVGVNGLQDTPLEWISKFEALRNYVLPMANAVTPKPEINNPFHMLDRLARVTPTPVVQEQSPQTPPTTMTTSLRIIERTLMERGIKPRAKE